MADEAVPAQPVADPVPEPAQAAPETQAVENPRLKALAELGFENVQDEGEAFDRLVSYTKNLKNEFSQQIQAAIEQVKATQPTAPTQVQEARDDGKWWNPPAVDTALVSKYRNADGSWKDGTPSDVRQQAEAAQAYYDRWASDLVHRPHEVLPKLIRQEAERIVQEQLGQTQQQQQFTQFQERIFTENDYLFEKDPISGRPNRNTLSAEGKLIDQYMREAQQRGADYEFAWDYAITKHMAAKAAATAAKVDAAKTAEQINAEQKKAMLNRGSGTANRTGSLPTTSEDRTTQRNRHTSFGRRVEQAASRNGVAVQ